MVFLQVTFRDVFVLGLRTTRERAEGDTLENFMTVKVYSFGTRETSASVIVQRSVSLEGCLRKTQQYLVMETLCRPLECLFACL
jgi:hypothetical protein